MTQFGRALHALNIDIICANSSQAKGRVERANATLQDRLVKEMRLCGIDTIAAGNAFLPAFIDDYNARFAKAPFDDRDIHRPLAGHDDLDDCFVWKEERSVSVNLTLQYDQALFILEPTGIARSLARKRVTVIDYPDGRLAIRHTGAIVVVMQRVHIDDLTGFLLDLGRVGCAYFARDRHLRCRNPYMEHPNSFSKDW